MIQYADKSGRLRNLEVGLYPNNEPVIKAPEIADVEVLYVRQHTLQEFVAAMFFADAMAMRGAPIPTLVLPLVPGVRMDRMLSDDASDFLFTLKSVADMINARHFESVYILDPHSDVAPALINNVVVITPAWVLIHHFNSSHLADIYDGIIAPDAGADKRAGTVAHNLSLPLIHAWKKREPGTNKLTGFGSEALPEAFGRYLVVDDLCDAGGTFIGLAEHLHQAWPDVALDLYVSHGLFTHKAEERLSKHYNLIMTSDSVPVAPIGVYKIPVNYLGYGEI